MAKIDTSNDKNDFKLNLGKHGSKDRKAVVKPKNFKGTIRRLWRYFLVHKSTIYIVFLISILSTFLSLIMPYLVGKSIDTMSLSSGIVDFPVLKIVVLVLLLTYVLDASISFIQNFIMAGLSQRIVLSLRRELFSKLQRLPISYFDTNSHGDTMSRLTNDIDNISLTITQSTIQLISGIIMLIGSFTMMIILSPILTFASLITIPLVIGLTKLITNKTKILFKKQQTCLGSLNGQIEEIISGIQIVKAFNREERVVDRFEKINTELCDVGIKAQIYSGFMMPILNVIGNLGFTVVAGLGGILAVKDIITVGVIASFISYSKQFTRPLNDLSDVFNTLQSAIASAERVFELLDEKEEDGDKDNIDDFKDIVGEVEFKNVCFGYRKDVSIIKDLSFKIGAGSKIAIVGPTGAGKTTIVNLLTRFYEVSSGSILIDGNDIRLYRREDLRKLFGIVLQDTYLFSGTIKENIKYGKLEASDEEVIEASKMANAHNFIKHLPMGYDTLLSESGGNLSQGQKQLLAISRAILCDATILILDEATSNVDTRTELKIQQGMMKLMEGKTSFIIAHRLSTIKDSDIIMVVDKGNIVEIGNHHELIKNKGIYFDMFTSQNI